MPKITEPAKKAPLSTPMTTTTKTKMTQQKRRKKNDISEVSEAARVTTGCKVWVRERH